MTDKDKKRLVVLTGAGISAESGVSTFRDSNGLWGKHRVEDVATPDGFARNPQLVLDFYNDLHRQMATVRPNYGHLGLVELERLFDVKVVTQNVDNLHEQAGSRNILHLHGELMKYASVGHKNLPHTWPFGEDLKMGDLADDGSQKRPFIVWFGEDVPNIVPAVELAKAADVFVVIGTSLNVYPAASLLQYVPNGCPIYLIDPNPVNVPPGLQVHVIQKGASEGMKVLVAMLAQMP